jgi:hypothetical protein
VRAFYFLASPPKWVVGETEREGSWAPADPLVVEVEPGSVRVSAFHVPRHPVVSLVRRNIPLPRAELAVEVPDRDVTVPLEFRASRLWSGRGKIRQL